MSTPVSPLVVQLKARPRVNALKRLVFPLTTLRSTFLFHPLCIARVHVADIKVNILCFSFFFALRGRYKVFALFMRFYFQAGGGRYSYSALAGIRRGE